MMSFRSAAALSFAGVLSVLQLCAVGVAVARAQSNEQERARAHAAQQQAAAARAAQQRAAQQQAAARAAQQRAAQEQARAAQQRATQEQARAAQQRAAQEQARAAQQRAAQEQARSAQQRAAQEQARAAQQRATQEQARSAQQRAAQEQARAAQQRAAQEQARAAQQRAAQEQARSAQQRAAQEQARAAQQRAAQDQARAAQQRAAQEQARSAQQRAAQDQARAAQQRAAQDQARERAAQEQARGARERAEQEQARGAQERAAREQARAVQQRRREGGPPPQGAPGQERTEVGQDRHQQRDARRAGQHQGDKRRAEAPSARLREVQRQRQERRQADRIVIREPGRRSIVRDNHRAFIRHDDNQRLAGLRREVRSERRGDATALSFSSRDGSRVFSEVNEEGRALRRYRRMRDGREIILFDDRRFYRPGLLGLRAPFVDLEPPTIEIPQDQYIVDYGVASEDDIYQALLAPPLEPLKRSYALEEIRQGYQLRERMRRVELLDINFEAGSWEISPDQYPKLERLAHVINRIVEGRPDEVFFIEGHTDVLDSDIDNLTLSDRRAEGVAFILSQMFAVPAENLVTQGYGDQFLKVKEGEINRRVSVRRITPLLRHEDAAVVLDQRPHPAQRIEPLALSDDDRALIVENVDFASEPRLAIGGISEGMRVPGGARLRSFPSAIRERIPVLEAYRFFVAENQVVIVDPSSAQIIAVLEGNR